MTGKKTPEERAMIGCAADRDTSPKGARSAKRRAAHAFAVVLAVLLAAGCGGQDAANTTGGSMATGTPRTPISPSPTSILTPGPRLSADTGASMNIEFVIGATELRGTLGNSPAARDFASLLPLTLSLEDYNESEKMSFLPRPLSVEGEPAGITPSPGDITFYAPWGNLALFFRDWRYSDGLVRLGRFDPGAVEILAGLDDGTTVTIQAAD